MRLVERIECIAAKWLHKRALERALRRWGGCQVCPWCKQWAQLHDGWHFDSVTDRTIDALHCGNCGGVSRWRFELGMMPLDPIGLTPPPVKCAAPASEPSWRCFHCDQVFTSEHCARLHFGADETHYPACQVKGSEGGLLRALREAEAVLMQLHHDAHDEAGPVLKGWRDAQHRHHQALIAMEETGYERGVADMRAEIAGDDVVNALRAARQFISNGIELGYIRMPDPATPDSAHDTLPMIEAALTRLTRDQVTP